MKVVGDHPLELRQQHRRCGACIPSNDKVQHPCLGQNHLKWKQATVHFEVQIPVASVDDQTHGCSIMIPSWQCSAPIDNRSSVAHPTGLVCSIPAYSIVAHENISPM